jgi:hypothetical protein
MTHNNRTQTWLMKVMLAAGMAERRGFPQCAGDDFHVPESPGHVCFDYDGPIMPIYRWASNEYWWVPPSELRQALHVWRSTSPRRMDHVLRAAARECDLDLTPWMISYWDEFVALLAFGAEHDGLTVI